MPKMNPLDLPEEPTFEQLLLAERIERLAEKHKYDMGYLLEKQILEPAFPEPAMPLPLPSPPERKFTSARDKSKFFERATEHARKKLKN